MFENCFVLLYRVDFSNIFAQANDLHSSEYRTNIQTLFSILFFLKQSIFFRSSKIGL